MIALILHVIPASAQTAEIAPANPPAVSRTVIPQWSRYDGVAQTRAGDTVEMVFEIYTAQEGGEALWNETQQVTIASDGKYTAFLGASSEAGLPQTVFAGGQARWLGVTIERAPEQSRVPLASVAYAMKAADAETLAGLPAAEFVTQAQLRADGLAPAEAAPVTGKASTDIRSKSATTPTGSGTTGAIPLWSGASTLGSSALTQTQVSGVSVIAGKGSLQITSPSSTTQTPLAGFSLATTGVAYGVAGQSVSATTGSGGLWGQSLASTGQVYGVIGQAVSTTNDAAAVFARERATTGEVFGVYAESDSATTGATAVLASEPASTGTTYGVYSLVNSAAGTAVYGLNAGVVPTNATYIPYGIFGQSNGAQGIGVGGSSPYPTGETTGVSGQVASTGGRGVFGLATATTGVNAGVVGQSASTSGLGVSGIAVSPTGSSAGVYGQAASSSGAGVSGSATATSGSTAGVYGLDASSSGAGVVGKSTATTGATAGVFGQTASSSGAGVSGSASATTGSTAGVYGLTASTGPNATGVYGYAEASTGSNAGVLGETASTSGSGVVGLATATTGGTSGVTGVTSSTNSTAAGVVGQALAPGGTAGRFVNKAGSGLILQGISNSNQVFSVDATGNVTVAGTLNVTGKVTKGSGSFKIDHPLDPAHKYLSHSFVESPDMMNVYNGNIVTDKHGVATVVLPDYFEALNRDFRYQLTVVGQFAQAIVAKKVSANRFVIRTSKPGVEVSWQVTGIRQDAYANSDRIPVEEDKPAAEQGYYLHPEAFGQPATKSVAAAHQAQPSASEVQLSQR